MTEWDQLIYHQDLPIGSTSIFAQWEVMKCASQNKIKVLLDGQGADETLGGYSNFGGLYLLELLKKAKFARFLSDYGKLKRNFSPAVKVSLMKAAYYYLPKGMQQKLRSKERLSFEFVRADFIDESPHNVGPKLSWIL